MTHDSATADVDVDVAVAQLHDALTRARYAFARVAAAVGVVEWVQIVAGDPIRFRFAGDALVDHLAPAFEHHPVVDSSTDPLLTVHVWDAASTGALVLELAGHRTAPTLTRSIVGRSRCASSSPERARPLARKQREA